MKRIVLFIIPVFWAAAISAGEPAQKKMEKVFENYTKITTIEADVDVIAEETLKITGKKRLKASAKKVLIKKADKSGNIDREKDKKRVVLLNAATRQPLSLQRPEIKERDDKTTLTLYPECLFDAHNYFENFELFIMEKDERIKVMGEEIIAVRKEQKNEYPQIRIKVKNNRIQEMRFYSITGKRYYTMEIKEYIKIKGIDIPVKITEYFHAKKNEIKTDINYTIIRLNEAIDNEEFEL